MDLFYLSPIFLIYRLFQKNQPQEMFILRDLELIEDLWSFMVIHHNRIHRILKFT